MIEKLHDILLSSKETVAILPKTDWEVQEVRSYIYSYSKADLL